MFFKLEISLVNFVFQVVYISSSVRFKHIRNIREYKIGFQ